MCTAEEVAAAGRLQVVVPLYLEHLFTARALAEHGLASVVRPGTNGEEASAVLARTVASPAERARSFARLLPAPPRDLPNTLLEMLPTLRAVTA
jgi:hypothetical protein